MKLEPHVKCLYTCHFGSKETKMILNLEVNTFFHTLFILHVNYIKVDFNVIFTILKKKNPTDFTVQLFT